MNKSKDRISLYMFRNMIATFFVAFLAMMISLNQFYDCDVAQCLQRLFLFDVYTLLYFVLLWLFDYLFFEISKILYDLYEEKITFIPCIVLSIFIVGVYFIPMRDLFQYNVSFLFLLIILRMIKEMWKRTPELFSWIKKKRPDSGLK